MSIRPVLAALLVAAVTLSSCAGGTSEDPEPAPDTGDGVEDEGTEQGDGDAAADEDEEDPPGAEEEGDEQAAAYPVTIEHRHGETTIEERPERVVTVGLTDHDPVLALGVVPVGTNDWYGDHPGGVWPWAADLLDGEVPTVVGRSIELDLEAIAALDPDVIIGLYAGLDEQVYETLTGIAPTVAQPADYVDFGVPWQEQTRIVGEVLGMPEEADALVADAEAAVDRIRDQEPGFAGATAAVGTDFDGVYVYSPDTGIVRLITSLGFEVPEAIGELVGDADGAALSLERVELLDNDVMVWLDVEPGTGPVAEPVYTALDVHQQGREVFLSTSGELGGAGFISVLSVPVLAEALAPALSAAIDGDPDTEVPPIR
ncbi:MAG: ABC transporter substrate-binding protein [Nitriliruptoraceae bacterium]